MSKYPLTFKDFKQGLIDGKLLGLKCLDCGENMIPPGASCVACGSSRLEINSFSRIGIIRTFTVIRVAPLNFRVPYVVAMVELEDGPWVIGNVDLIGLLAEHASIELIGRQVSTTYKLVPKDPNEGGVDGCALVFELC